MALDTTVGGATANALIDVAFYTAYHTALGNVIEADAAKLEAAIIRGTNYIAGFKFNGTPVDSRTQALPFPMTGLTDRYGAAIDAASIPVEVMKATAEAAFLEVTTPNTFNPTGDPRDAQVQSYTDVLDVLSESKTYFRAGDTSTLSVTTNKRILDLLNGLIADTSSGFKTTLLARA